jgi:ankyrin repeat protein
MVAARYNRTRGIIEALAAAGADLGIRNNEGHTALQVARAHGNATVERALLAITPVER